MNVKAFFIAEVFSFQLDIRRGIRGLIHTIIINIISREEAEFVAILVMQSDDQRG